MFYFGKCLSDKNCILVVLFIVFLFLGFCKIIMLVTIVSNPLFPINWIMSIIIILCFFGGVSNVSSKMSARYNNFWWSMMMMWWFVICMIDPFSQQRFYTIQILSPGKINIIIVFINAIYLFLLVVSLLTQISLNWFLVWSPQQKCPIRCILIRT